MSVANHRRGFRPVRGGTLILQSVTLDAGTLGMVLTSDGIDRWLLTARHVVARRDHTLVVTDAVLQPDAIGGPIATLNDIVADQALDCAALKLVVSASSEILGIGALQPCKPPAVGMRVIKSGWKTGVSEGHIQHVNGTDVVVERLGGYPTDYLLATTGDSGAVWIEAATLAPVALHKSESAVGLHLAFACSLPAILLRLGLRQP